MVKNLREVSMPHELTITQSNVAAGLDAQATQEDAFSVQLWEPGLKPTPNEWGQPIRGAKAYTRNVVDTATGRDPQTKPSWVTQTLR
jgi:hypothetical protein